ncbi:MAG TPA: hypothetical protein PKV67_04630 [Hyphomonas sp.]|nr:hypothetical protein [Hyphomonas sp.]HRJ00038.1 hypothetical protein [Hyphomonas sp.]HRK67796.1 hypothetical protein [Hyphomonas sp.]
MKRIVSAGLLVLAAACATPGYDYVSRAAPNYPQALDYTDVVTGRFGGPAGEVAEQEFDALLQSAELEGRPWFNVIDSDRPQGIYEGGVEVTGYRAEITYNRVRRCVEYDGIFDCERRATIEQRCIRDIVDVAVTAHLIDYASGRRVFTSTQGGAAEQQDCFDIKEVWGTDLPEGSFGPTEQEIYDPWSAPYGMIAQAVPAAVAQFRTDIAPYMATFRAEIVTKPLTGEEAGDPRFAAAVKATKSGHFIGACAQWDELATAWPSAPGILHNQAACMEARGNLAGAHAQYARAADLARQIPLLKDKDAKPIFDALSRVSRGRYEEKMIDGAIEATDEAVTRLRPETR